MGNRGSAHSKGLTGAGRLQRSKRQGQAASGDLLGTSTWPFIAWGGHRRNMPKRQSLLYHKIKLCQAVNDSFGWCGNIHPSGWDFQGIDTITRLSLSMVASPQSPLPFRPVRSL